jgi:hypothetical protein
MIEQVVDRTVSRFGVHGVHVIRAGGPVDREEWIQQVVPEGAVDFEFWEYEEAELGMWHLKLWWKEKGAERYEWVR